jgi:hypothetical protein
MAYNARSARMNQLINSKYGIDDNLDSAAPDDTGATPTKDAGSMGTADWVGIGLQVAGAMANQKEEDQAKALEAKRHTEALGLGARSRMDTLQQNAVTNQQNARSQNQKGLEYMTGLVSENEAAGRKRAPSFRQTMLYGSM